MTLRSSPISCLADNMLGQTSVSARITKDNLYIFALYTMLLFFVLFISNLNPLLLVEDFFSFWNSFVRVGKNTLM